MPCHQVWTQHEPGEVAGLQDRQVVGGQRRELRLGRAIAGNRARGAQGAGKGQMGSVREGVVHAAQC